MEKNQKTHDKKERKFSLNLLNPVKSVIARGYYTALIAIIIVLIAAYATTIPGSKRSLTDQAEGSLLDLSQSYIKILESRISTINDDMEYMSSQADIYGCLVMNSEVSLVTAELKAFIRKNSDYLYAAIYDKDGKFVTASADGYSKDDNPYYVNAALSLKRPMQSDYIKVDGKDSVIFAMPLINSGNLMGCATITVPVEKFTSDLAAVKMEDMESGFAYLISPLGYFLYHPDSEYIGKITGEEVLRDVISQGNVVSAVAHFDENIAGLATSETNGWTLVIQANTNELLKSVDDTVAKSVVLCIIIALLISIVAYIAIYVFLHPIVLMTKEITNISSLDFTSTKEIDKLTKQQTEIGTMAKEIKKMHVNLKEVISDLNDMTQKISSGSNELSEIATSLTDCSSENSAVSEELAAGMGQTADAVSSIKGEVDTIKKRTTEINRQSQSSIDLSSEIMGRAEGARQSVVESTNSTRSLYSKMSEDAHIALEQSKAVNKINDLTKNILDIAEQTSLLALNASIEAARSGKYGKGFAVVAKEISTLAQETSNTVTGIMSIVTEVTNAVNNLDSCLTRTLDFIDTSVMQDYDSFTGMSDAYRNDAKSFEVALTEIKNSLLSLETATNDIVGAVYGIDATVSESSSGVMTIAERSTEVVELSDKTYNQVKLNAQMSETLQGIVDKFKL